MGYIFSSMDKLKLLHLKANSIQNTKILLKKSLHPYLEKLKPKNNSDQN